jgi:hypothetical protein
LNILQEGDKQQQQLPQLFFYPYIFLMKQILLVAVIFLALVGTACKAIDELLTFYIDEQATIVVDSDFPIGLAPIAPVSVTTNSSDTFKNNQTRAELVKDVTLNKLTLSIKEPNGQNFDFLSKIEIYISSEGNNEVKIAYLENVPKGVNQIELESTNAPLDKFIKADKYTIRTQATLSKAVTQDVSIQANMRFKVTADPI